MTLDLFQDRSTADDGQRSEGDFYETPVFMTRSLIQLHPAIRGTRVLECCSGRDAIANVLREEAGCTVFTNDIDSRHPSQQHADATSADWWEFYRTSAGWPEVDWVITNPPFHVAMQILRHAHAHARVGVAFLLRKTFLEPTEERGPWLQEHPPTRVIGEPRYNFRGKGSDSVSCDWCIWECTPDRSLAPFVIDYVAERRTR